MKLLITETNWWGWDNPGQTTKDFEYDMEKLRLWRKTIVSSDGETGKRTINFAFKVLSKKADEIKIKAYGEHLIFEGKLLPCVITLKKDEGQFLSTQSKDGGTDYSIILK